MFHEMLFLLVLMSANAACETQVRCHQIKVITVNRSKLTITFYKIVVIYWNSLALRYYLRQSLGNLFPNFCSELNMMWLILAKYSISGTRIRGISHPWMHQQEFKVLENSRCTTCFQSLVNTSLVMFFFSGVGRGSVQLPPPGGFFK